MVLKPFIFTSLFFLTSEIWHLINLSMTDCIFCKIIKGEIPNYKVYEDDNFLVFLEKKPLSDGHCLVISKTHYQWTYDVPNFGQFWEVAQKIALAQIQALNCEFVSFMTLGKDVPHAHIHVIPHFKTDYQSNLTPEEMQNIAQKISSILKQ